MSDQYDTLEDLEDDDDLEAEELDAELADYDSQDFWAPKRSTGHTYLDGMWSRSGFGYYDRQARGEEAIIIAHNMVSGFLNAFARDGYYHVTFNPNVKTAGTDMDRKIVVLTTAPIVDPSLEASEAGRILTGLAGHEISHPRFGKDTHWAIRQAFPNSKAASKLSNLLDDVRIERRFIEQYPGYAGIFEPTLAYIAKGAIERNGGKLLKPRGDAQINMAIAAVRYPDTVDWKHWEHERDWWQAWARRHAKEDASRRHVAAIREALEHIVANKIKFQLALDAQKQNGDEEPPDEDAPFQAGGVAPQSEGDTPQDDDGGQETAGSAGEEDGQDDASDDSDDDLEGDEKIDAEGAGSSPDASHDAGDEEGSGEMASDDELLNEGINSDVGALDDKDLGEAADEGEPTGPQTNDLPTCAGRQSVEQSARDQGVDPTDIKQAEEQADQAIENAKLYEDDGHGRKVDVARSLKNLIRSRMYNRSSGSFSKSDVAARYIRDAILRSRTGHTNLSRYQKRGRLNQQSLHRVTEGDYRLFDRKHAVSPGRYLIWMLLDRSGSMDGWESVQAAQVATAIADALNHVKTTRAAVWAWSDSFRDRGDYYGGGPGVALIWRTGQSTDEIKRSIDLPGGGTPDAEIMGWAARAIKREAKRGEQPVIIMCSDGWGSSLMTERVAEARAMGVDVVSVAFGNLDEEEQERRFGRDKFIAWQGNIIATSRPLSRMIAKLVGRDQREQARRRRA